MMSSGLEPAPLYWSFSTLDFWLNGGTETSLQTAMRSAPFVSQTTVPGLYRFGLRHGFAVLRFAVPTIPFPMIDR